MSGSSCLSLPLDIIDLICQAADRQVLLALYHTSSAWRFFSLPQLWRCIDIGEWEQRADASDIHAAYSRYVVTLQCRRHSRRRRSSNRRSSSPEATPELKTRTEILTEWLGFKWPSVQRVVIGAWPPYNVDRVQAAVALACPQLRYIELDAVAAVWLPTLRRAITMHPHLCEFHVTEDARSLLTPVAGESHTSQAVRFDGLPTKKLVA
ncbi:hypothetical protein LPJ78_005219 [Coemansia sp. RSA 989]|nr:hypothetical protein LPJ78_005219 [Coemansia sp. RSA 989]KAJ1869613.1 hypothetical protein LPJ55_005251 [Coemansia sp. RSA 990]